MDEYNYRDTVWTSFRKVTKLSKRSKPNGLVKIENICLTASNSPTIDEKDHIKHFNIPKFQDINKTSITATNMVFSTQSIRRGSEEVTRKLSVASLGSLQKKSIQSESDILEEDEDEDEDEGAVSFLSPDIVKSRKKCRSNNLTKGG